jgi:hypothetical protein
MSKTTMILGNLTGTSWKINILPGMVRFGGIKSDFKQESL